jgi:hypothetical protein
MTNSKESQHRSLLPLNMISEEHRQLFFLRYGLPHTDNLEDDKISSETVALQDICSKDNLRLSGDQIKLICRKCSQLYSEGLWLLSSCDYLTENKLSPVCNCQTLSRRNQARIVAGCRQLSYNQVKTAMQCGEKIRVTERGSCLC